MRVDVWYTDLENLRFSRTELWHDGYVDVCRTDAADWSLVPSQLTIADSQHPAPHRDFSSFSGEFKRMLRKLAWGGFGSALSPVSASANADALVVRAENPAYSTMEWECDTAGDRLLPTRSEVLEAPQFPDVVGNTTLYEDWRLDPVLEGWIAGKVVELAANGGKIREVTLRELRELEAGEFASVVAVPDVSGEDVLRGVPTFRTVLDLRPGIEKRTMIHGDGQIAEFAIPSDQLGRAPTRWMRRAGWGAAGLIIALLVGIRVYQRRSGV